MRCTIVLAAFVATVSVVSLAAHAAPFTAKQKLELLATQNKYRVEVGVPALKWSNDLAASAQKWAHQLADDVHALKHSGGAGKGENIAMSTAGRATLAQLVDSWGAERHYFIESSFPNVSRTGSWSAVAHYTQMIWRNTTEVGCGLATGGGNDYLVCQYAPQGNFMGEKVY
ncbi:MAG TPA: CAP family protein [Rhizomicrobium sp.]